MGYSFYESSRILEYGKNIRKIRGNNMKWESEIRHFVVTGDTHGDTNRVQFFADTFDIQHVALIILGDAGYNFYLNKTDRKKKEFIQELGCLVYLVRGNHEERPENLPNILNEYDDNVKGNVYYEPKYPHIRYFMDGGIYNLEGFSTLVIGGAYSVDKHHRLARASMNGWDPETHWTGWFKDEQLTSEEMFSIEKKVTDMNFDFVLTHTCPYSWQPFDLFLRGLDQSTVDNSMEKWFDDLKDKISWKYAWCFGHFHEDRIIRPHVEMYMENFQFLSDIAWRWEDWDNGYRLPWGVNLSYATYSFWNEDIAKRKPLGPVF